MAGILKKMATVVKAGLKSTPASINKAPSTTKKPATSTAKTTRPSTTSSSGSSSKSSSGRYYSSGGRYYSSGGGGGGGSKTTKSTTTQTTKNTTKKTDAARKKQVQDLADLLNTSAQGGQTQLAIDLDRMLNSLLGNYDMAQRQYTSSAEALKRGYLSQTDNLDAIQLGTEQALGEETTTTNTEWGRMLREATEQLAGLGAGETDTLRVGNRLKVDQIMQDNQSLRAAYDTTFSTNQQRALAYTDATAGMSDLNNSLEKELADLKAGYTTDASNRTKAEYSNQADIYKQIAAAWNQLELEYAQRQDEAKGQKVSSTTKTESDGSTTTDKNTATYKIKTSMTAAQLKKAKANAKTKAASALTSAKKFAGRTVKINAPDHQASLSDFQPELKNTTLKHNFDINDTRAQTQLGKRVSGSTVRW